MICFSTAMLVITEAYMISVSGSDIAACATYAEAEDAVSVFRDYIVGYVEKTDGGEGEIELTTEFSIRNVFCSAAKISTAEGLRRSLTDGFEEESAIITDGIAGTRVTAAADFPPAVTATYPSR